MFLSSLLVINCFELYPNFGKSMLIGIIASYLWLTEGAKVLVIEPNEGLAFTHKKKFCHDASKV
jgi:hypothetical protein